MRKNNNDILLFVSFTFLFGLSSIPNFGVNAQITVMTCWSSYITSGLDFTNVENYPDYFNDESVLTVGEIGQFRGASEIEEFGNIWASASTSPFYEYGELIDATQTLKYADYGEIEGECVLILTYTSHFRTNSAIVANEAFDVSTMFKVYYFPTWTTMQVTRVYAFLSENYWNSFYGDMLNTQRTFNYICDVMQDSCPEVWGRNGFTSSNECTNAVSTLPVVGRRNDVSGNTTGCRAINAALAEQNPSPSRCFALSVTPVVSTNDNINVTSNTSGITEGCQNSNYRNPSIFFTRDDYAMFEERNREIGMDASGFNLCNCPDDYNPNRLLTLWVRVWNFFVSPYPQQWPTIIGGLAPNCGGCGSDNEEDVASPTLFHDFFTDFFTRR